MKITRKANKNPEYKFGQIWHDIPEYEYYMVIETFEDDDLAFNLVSLTTGKCYTRNEKIYTSIITHESWVKLVGEYFVDDFVLIDDSRINLVID